LHPDVASALHNVGIVQLRALNHAEALKAFEEAARIRKGALGRDHPQVAVSWPQAYLFSITASRAHMTLYQFSTLSGFIGESWYHTAPPTSV
jgi:hypothetical protein